MPTAPTAEPSIRVVSITMGCCDSDAAVLGTSGSRLDGPIDCLENLSHNLYS
jgi:hypothetical protein